MLGRRLADVTAIRVHRADGDDHPDATHPIALHWRRASPLAVDFRRLADDFVTVKREIRAARDERFR